MIGLNELPDKIDKYYTELNKWTVIRDLEGAAMKHWLIFHCEILDFSGAIKPSLVEVREVSLSITYHQTIIQQLNLGGRLVLNFGHN